MDIASEITLSAVAENVPQFVDFVCNYAMGSAIEDARIGEIGQAMEEITNNIIGFAYGGQPGEIEVSCRTDDIGSIHVTVIDWGAPFNMLLADIEPAFFGFGDKTAGPSLKAIKRVFKNIEYKRDETRNILVLVVMRELKDIIRQAGGVR